LHLINVIISSKKFEKLTLDWRTSNLRWWIWVWNWRGRLRRWLV